MMKLWQISWAKAWALILPMTLTACVSAPKAVQTIQQNRQSIVNTTQFSHTTLAAVLSSGLSQTQCLADFLLCLDKVNDTFVIGDSKSHLLIQAELHYAYAKHLKTLTNCQLSLQRPPIDANFPNRFSQLTFDEQQAQQVHNEACLSAHRTALLDTVRYSYAYLFYDELMGKDRLPVPVVGEGQIRAQDLYHIGTHDIVEEVYRGKLGSFAFVDKRFDGNWLGLDRISPTAKDLVKIYELDSPTPSNKKNQLHFLMTNEIDYLAMTQDKTVDILDYLDLTYEDKMSGVNVVSTRAGLGVGYVGSPANRYQTTWQGISLQDISFLSTTPTKDKRSVSVLDSNPKERIYPMQHLLLTGLIVPMGKTLDEVLITEHFEVRFYNPSKTQTVEILGVRQPLYANFSSVYTKWLLENQFRVVSLANMLAQDSKLPNLYMLEPYNPNKKVIIMIHGLASSPTTWVNLTNNLLANPVLRDNYQVWQIFYATNLPILENRYQIHRLIQTAFEMTDPQAKDSASKEVVLIGHSMGAIISRLLVSNDNLLPRLDTLGVRQSMISQPPLEGVTPEVMPNALPSHADIKKRLSHRYRQDFEERFRLSALPQVDTVVFISAPHRGTDYADRWFTRALRRVIHLPLDITQSITGTLSDIANPEVIANHSLGALYLQNGASQLSDKSAFIELTQDVKIAPKVVYHSIMANNTGNEVAVGDTISDTVSDGIVPYSSSHLAGAASETILNGEHSIHTNPQTILHLRTILHEHLDNTSKQ